MIATVSSFLTGPFFADYFKDIFVVAILIAYFIVLFLSRPSRRGRPGEQPNVRSQPATNTPKAPAT